MTDTETRKVVFFAFTGGTTCFVHVLLNAMDFADKGWESRIVVEGSATKALCKMADKEHKLHGLYVEVMDRKLFDGACRACSKAMGVLERIEECGLPLLADLRGHPSMAAYREKGFQVITL